MPTQSEATERDLVDEVEELLAKATPGPWAVWDSCSWRRIGTREPFADGNVICPVTQRDGHPDLLAKREDLELAAAAPELLRRLVEEVKTQSQLVEIQSRESDGDLTTLQKALTENAVLREQLAQLEQAVAASRGCDHCAPLIAVALKEQP